MQDDRSAGIPFRTQNQRETARTSASYASDPRCILSLTEAQRAAYRFLRQRATDGDSFTAANIESVAGWREGAFSTYKTKHFKGYLTRAGKGKYKVEPRFLRVTEEEYAEIVGQSRRTVARFRRTVVHSAVRYEFLLPLTNERKLREALDELFYREPLELRAREIGRGALSQIVPADDGEADEAYYARIVDRVGSLLGGYSIGHVDGRFRASPLLTYSGAAEVLAKRGRYLVDETTAVVRFILPILESQVVHGATFAIGSERSPSRDVSAHVDVARQLFIAFFVESVILGIHEEDEIWFLESGPMGERLYVLERETPKPKQRSTTRKLEPAAGQLNLPQIGGSLDAWLRQNDYREVADKIAGIMSTWKANGVKTRRNWWDVLAGDQQGNPREVAGVQFPIIAAIRSRQGLPPATGALSRRNEKPPPAK